MTSQEILSRLPYTEPFLFVDEIDVIHEEGVSGNYTFSEDSYFFKGHFRDVPVTPGVILTECMAQIGVVCLGIFLLGDKYTEGCRIALSNTKVDFYHPVFPEEKVKVTSEKLFFRFQKLKCKVSMHNSEGRLICKGEISGMLKTNE